MIHHTAVSYKLNNDQFESINKYHQEKWNFASTLGFYVGYNYVINNTGRLSIARQPGERTAAAYQKQMNSGICIHIALEGNFEIEEPGEFQIYKLRDQLRFLIKIFNIKKENIVFHKFYSKTLCPGKNMDIDFVRNIAYE